MQTDPDHTPSIPDFISGIALRLNISLSSYQDFSRNMVRALETIGKFTHHDRVHILEIGKNMNYTIQYEWSNQHLSPIDDQQRHNTLLYDLLLEQQLCNQSYVTIDLNDDSINPAIHALLQLQNCKRLLLLPLFESGSQFAFICLMQCDNTHEWNNREIRTLQDISSIIATQLNNYYLVTHLLYHIKKYKTQQLPTNILHSRLRQLHAEIIPTWNLFKNTDSGPREKQPTLTQLDQQISTLDQICRLLAEK